MAVKAIKPIVINDLVLRLGDATTGDEFQKAITSAILTPSSSNVTFQGGTPDAAFTFPGPVSWTLNLTYAQDVDTAGSLSQYLWEHQGEEIEFMLKPKATGTTEWAGTVIIAPGAAGGAVAAVATATVALGVQGAPTPTFPTA